MVTNVRFRSMAGAPAHAGELESTARTTPPYDFDAERPGRLVAITPVLAIKVRDRERASGGDLLSSMPYAAARSRLKISLVGVAAGKTPGPSIVARVFGDRLPDPQ